MVKKLKCSVLLLLFLLIQNTSFARSVGCLIGTNTVYTTQVPSGLLGTGILGGTKLYYKDSGIIVGTQCISHTATSCRICPGTLSTFLGLIIGCSGGFASGTEVNYILNCDLDSGNLMLLMFSSSCGLWFLTKKNK